MFRKLLLGAPVLYWFWEKNRLFCSLTNWISRTLRNQIRSDPGRICSRITAWDQALWSGTGEFVIVLNSCCISIGLVFIKDRPVSSFWVLRFRDRVLRFRDLGASFSSFGCFVFEIGCFVFEIWVLRFRVLGASCFGLRFRNYLVLLFLVSKLTNVFPRNIGSVL